MEKRHVIKQDLYTNSLLISPNPDQNSISDFYWTKKNSIFSSTKQKRLINTSHQLYYQCTLLDYLSIIELNLIDQKGNKITYAFGPIQLQADLLLYLKPRELTYSIKTIFNKKQVIQACVKIKEDEQDVKIIYELQNGFNLILTYPQSNSQDDYQGMFKIQQLKNNEMDLNFFKDRKIVVQLLKKLKIYSYQGHFLKMVFKNQLQRDIFLLKLLTAVGFIFQPQLRIKNQNQIQLSQLKTQQSQNKQVHGYQQLYQMSFMSNKMQKDNVFNEFYDILVTPKGNKYQSKEKEKFQPRIQKAKTQQQEAPVFNLQLQNFKHSNNEVFFPRRKNTFSSIYQVEQKIKNRDQRRKISKQRFKKFKLQKKLQQSRIKYIIQQNKKLHKNNENLNYQNKQLRQKIGLLSFIQQPTIIKQKESNVPQFIKVKQIERALKNNFNNRFSTQKLKISFDKLKVSSDKLKISCDKLKSNQKFGRQENYKNRVTRYEMIRKPSNFSGESFISTSPINQKIVQKQRQGNSTLKKKFQRPKPSQCLINMKSLSYLPKSNQFCEKNNTRKISKHYYQSTLTKDKIN